MNLLGDNSSVILFLPCFFGVLVYKERVVVGR